MQKLVIFDVDGTLVDSEPKGVAALKDVIPELELSLEELSLRYRGRKLELIFDDIRTKLGIALPGNITALYREACWENLRQGVEAFPYVAQVLDSFSCRFCLASNAPPAKIQLNLESSKLDRFFPRSNWFSAYKVNAWKPDPALFFHAANEMRFEPKDCVVIEDSETGIAAAQAAGISVIQFREVGATQLCENWFSDYRHLPDLIDKIS